MPRKRKLKFETVLVPIGDLTDHPRNYREHPPDQLEHIKASIRKHGFYRNVVVAKDNTILAGHGVVQAVREMDVAEVPVYRVNIDPDSPQALQILTGDNEIENLGIMDDRALTDILKDIKDFDPDGLMGTGFDDMMLASLVYVTRPRSEIEDFDHAAHWVGMPEYEEAEKSKDRLRCIVSFQSEEDREAFFLKLGVKSKVTDATKTMWYPWRENDDVKNVQFEKTEA